MKPGPGSERMGSEDRAASPMRLDAAPHFRHAHGPMHLRRRRRITNASAMHRRCGVIILQIC
eukprot:4979657-Pyramimonas_sp.AAC.1